MKSNRCECGSKKQKNVDVCFKCAQKKGVLKVYGHGPVELIPDIVVETVAEEVVKECPIQAVESKAKIVTKPKRKKRGSK